MVACDLGQPRGDCIERLIPGDPRELPLSFGPGTLLGIEQAVRRILAIQVFRDLGAEEAAGDRVVGIAAKPGGPAVLDRHQDGASVRTVQSAGGVNNLLRHDFSIRRGGFRQAIALPWVRRSFSK